MLMCNSCPGEDLFLPPEKRVRDKKQRLKHPFQGASTKKNGKGYCLNLNQKDLPTQHLDSSKFLADIQSYLANLSKEDCCFFPFLERQENANAFNSLPTSPGSLRRCLLRCRVILTRLSQKEN